MGTDQPRNLARTIARHVFVFFFGIAFPLGSFLVSSELSPFWKGDAKFNFLSLLLASKIVLLPLAIYAVVAFFRTQIYPRKKPARWETIGLCVGVVVAIFSLGAGFFTMGLNLFTELGDLFIALFTFPFLVIKSLFPLDTDRSLQTLFISVSFSVVNILVLPLTLAPFYTPIWYGWAAWKALQSKNNKEQATTDAAIATFMSLPFMGAALIYAQSLYEKLPNTAPDCYIASATAMTPTRFMRTINHPNTGQPLSRQLLIFKAFEYSWIESTGMSYSIFRSFYDFVGPIFARLIRLHPLVAALGYFCLKPAEIVAWAYLQWRKQNK